KLLHRFDVGALLGGGGEDFRQIKEEERILNDIEPKLLHRQRAIAERLNEGVLQLRVPDRLGELFKMLAEHDRLLAINLEAILKEEAMQLQPRRKRRTICSEDELRVGCFSVCLICLRRFGSDEPVPK